ncbi:MFS transporter [Pleionea litopenaei]|uniref:MFS transporter n=1 Tax=Pleionea litopenaei TaxID=3070815 RepID=A0AA51RW89_9GAMM|nr:MFS transporter [Pleionea sp. HL-JVS1]WMS88941.1 MFS transporter [Pleionea sp. HL-JVS1]
MEKTQQSSAMNTTEKKAAFSLSAVFASRMLGLFMVLPVFAVLGESLDQATPLLIGLAIGAYGLTQAVFQIPFGRLSDRFGRKPVILAGLLLFAVGSVVAALSESIYGVIAGRLLQGCGAIASAVMALAADLSRDEQRSKVMASIGMSIGLAFTIAMFSGPFVAEHFGLSGVFWTTAILAVLAALIILFLTPSPQHRYVQRDVVAGKGQMRQILRHPQLWRLDLGIFALHFLLTAFFVAFPHKLTAMGVSLTTSGWIYLAVMGIAVVFMVPLIITAEKKWLHRQVMVVVMCAIAGLEVIIGYNDWSLWALILLMGLFFAGFNVMEALFPSLISRIAPPSAKGAALGVYSTSQFLGASLGGPIAGYLAQTYGLSATYSAGAIIAVLWAVAGLGLKSPPRLTSYTLTVHHIENEARLNALLDDIYAIRGVAEAVALPEAGAVYLKVDKQNLDEDALLKLKQSVSV